MYMTKKIIIYSYFCILISGHNMLVIFLNTYTFAPQNTKKL